ncbi:hypothetical protein CAEBREN_32198 [Caenorhabditis brenneri]|uniref:DDHD domain-containing protein n=1 Tax=Caenorhabditis brenneri TaxID=135651 RepID=G0N636_CAEBE|nr:hypothetical protein CAEBREN_32198 [Caenorhabditis brenneri]
MPGLGANHDPFAFKVDCLFTVGSPLRRFIEERGEPAKQLFRETYLKLRIYNVFYKKDIIAEGLEPIVHPSYKYLPPVVIPSVIEKNVVYIGLRFAVKPIVSAVKKMKRYLGSWRVTPHMPHLAERIDHIIQPEQSCVEEVCVETCDDVELNGSKEDNEAEHIARSILLDSFGTTIRPLSAEEERDVENSLVQNDLFNYIPLLFFGFLVFAVLVKLGMLFFFRM